MLKNRFDPKSPYRALFYGRMSSKMQNEASPEQQLETVNSTLRRAAFPWDIIGTYIDRGISGRTISKRPEFQQMLRDIYTKTVICDVILVDTYERLGRADELGHIRHELATKHGVLVLTADSGFSDPQSVGGKALVVVDQIRSTEENRIKAHQVLRGKRHALNQKYWPGGPPPFGYTTKLIMSTRNGREEVDHSVLVKDPAASWIVELIFNTAHETGWGTTRLAKFLNKHPKISDAQKPFYPDSIGYMIDNPIYYGEMLWEEHSTGIVNDRRVIERNLDSEMLRIPDYCEPTISRELWDQVHELWLLRSDKLKANRSKTDGDGKIIRRRGAGIALKYPLTGLLRCGDCGRSMRPMSSGGRTYAYYHCPGKVAGVCVNKIYVREGWLRECVIGKIRERLLPPPSDGTTVPDWFPELVEMVKVELTALAAADVHKRPSTELEITELTEKLKGWSMSLGNPNLSPQLRDDITTHYGEAQKRIAQLQADITSQETVHLQLAQLADPEAVLLRLHKLAEVLNNNNPTRTNLELSKHIDSIRCFADGKIEMCTSMLGIMEGVELLLRSDCQPAPDGTVRSNFPIVPRRRAHLDSDPAGTGSESASEVDARDPSRFEGLDGKWFWKETLDVPVGPKCWAADHAQEVFALRNEGWTQQRIAMHFEVSIPTIRHALKIASAANGSEQ